MELRGRLSNPDLRRELALAARAVAPVEIDHQSTTSPTSARQRWRIVDRLGEQVIHELVRDSRAGTTQPKLADRYGISLSSVKRLVRRSACRPS